MRRGEGEPEDVADTVQASAREKKHHSNRPNRLAPDTYRHLPYATLALALAIFSSSRAVATS